MMTDSVLGHSRARARSTLWSDPSPHVRSYNILMYSMTGEWCGGIPVPILGNSVISCIVKGILQSVRGSQY